MNKNMAYGLVAMVWLFGGTMVEGIADIADAHAAQINEDDPGWSCVDDGNRICGPGNSEGKPAGCYDEGGVLVTAWPCHVVSIGNGQTDVEADPGSPDYDEGMTY